MGSVITPMPRGGGPGGSPRLIHPLPPGIPILPGHVRASGRGSRKKGLIILLVIAGLAALVWFKDWYSSYDGKRIDAVVTPVMMFDHPKFGTRLTVTLRAGPRTLKIGSAFLEPGTIPVTTCVSVFVIDPKTGARDPNYDEHFDCIKGLAYRIPYPVAH